MDGMTNNPAPMRILHVLDHSLPLHSGYAFRTRSILEQQRALGWETFALTGPKQGPGALVELAAGLRFYRTAPLGALLARTPLLNHVALTWRTYRRLLAVAREVRPTLIHAHSPALNAVAALRAGRRLGIPVVYEVRALWEDAAVDHGTTKAWSVRYRLGRALETYVLRRVDAATTICEGLRAEIAARGIPASRITVIPNSVDAMAFAARTQRDEELAASLGLRGRRVIGFIGSFYAYEGLHLLVDAMPALLAADPQTRLLLVGGGPQEAALRSRAVALPPGSVVFTGRVPHADIGRYYDLCDVLVYPRLKMRLTDLVTPLKPLEAMAQGRLLAASDVGGHREMIEDGRNGVLFKPGSAAALADKVSALLADRASWPRLREAARRYVESERSWAGSVARYAAVYASVTGGAAR